jgi:DNA repair exonuclease SbcCD ATPase subunit
LSKTLASVQAELLQAQKKEAETKHTWDTLRANDPTSVDAEKWQRLDTKLTLEEKQCREALHLLKSGTGEVRCPTCNQRFIEHTVEQRIQHITSWLQAELPSQRQQAEQLKKQLLQKRKEWLQKQQGAEEQWSQWRKKLSELEKQVHLEEELRHQHEVAQAQLYQAQQDWIALNEQRPIDPQEKNMLLQKKTLLSKRLDGLRQKAEFYAQLPAFLVYLEKKRQEQEQLRCQMTQLQHQQTSLGYDAKTFQSVKEALNEMRSQAVEIQDELKRVQSALLQAQWHAQTTQEAAARAETYVGLFSVAVRDFQKEKRLHMLLEDFKKHFFAANSQEVVRRTAQLLLHVITDQSILGIKFEGNEFYYLDAGNVPRPVGRLSGGEKALLGLCLRIALAEQAQRITSTGKVKFLILDEVLSSLDDERCDAVQRIFEDVLQHGIFDHIIMITHLDTVKQCWRATGIEVQKVGSKTSQVISFSPYQNHVNGSEEYEDLGDGPTTGE